MGTQITMQNRQSLKFKTTLTLTAMGSRLLLQHPKPKILQ